jgi:hypothetical protein
MVGNSVVDILAQIRDLAQLIAVLLIVLMISVGVAGIAKWRDLNVGASLALSLFLTPIAGLIYLAAVPTKQCPSCAERIKFQATRCRFCLSPLAAPADAARCSKCASDLAPTARSAQG